MLTYTTHPQEVQEMQDIINTGRFFSIAFIKADNTVRYASGHKKIYDGDSPDTEKRGKFNRLEKNILLVWDVNKTYVNKKGDTIRGAYISAKLDRILFFKSGNFQKDYTEENQQAIEQAGMTPEDVQKVNARMKLEGMIQQEAIKLFELNY